MRIIREKRTLRGHTGFIHSGMIADTRDRLCQNAYTRVLSRRVRGFWGAAFIDQFVEPQTGGLKKDTLAG